MVNTMYKTLTYKTFTITFHRFSKTAKNVSPSYKMGFHYWVDDTQRRFSIVFPFCFRIILSKDLPNSCCQAEAPVRNRKRNS